MMTVDQACVIAKEITIGQQVPCQVHCATDNRSVVVVDLTNTEDELRSEIMLIGERWNCTVVRWKNEVRFE